MVIKDKKGNYICAKIIENKICGGLLWDFSYTSSEKVKIEKNSHFIKCPRCEEKHYMIRMKEIGENSFYYKFIECLE